MAAGGRHAHRFDCGCDDVKNNKQGRGQERGCDPTLTHNARNGASLLSLYIVYLYSMFSIALVHRSMGVCTVILCFSAVFKKLQNIFYLLLTLILIYYLPDINKVLAQYYCNDIMITNNSFQSI